LAFQLTLLLLLLLLLSVIFGVFGINNPASTMQHNTTSEPRLTVQKVYACEAAQIRTYIRATRVTCTAGNATAASAVRYWPAGKASAGQCWPAGKASNAAPGRATHLSSSKEAL
jgi:hypothetical protein